MPPINSVIDVVNRSYSLLESSPDIWCHAYTKYKEIIVLYTWVYVSWVFAFDREHVRFYRFVSLTKFSYPENSFCYIISFARAEIIELAVLPISVIASAKIYVFSFLKFCNETLYSRHTLCDTRFQRNWKFSRFKPFFLVYYGRFPICFFKKLLNSWIGFICIQNR